MNIFDRIYQVVKQIPPGTVATYALHVNPEPGVIPCHRVVKRDGSVSEAFAFGGQNRQVELLRAEGVGFIDETHVDMARYRVPFLPMA